MNVHIIPSMKLINDENNNLFHPCNKSQFKKETAALRETICEKKKLYIDFFNTVFVQEDRRT